jgi:hypothetical protein
MILGAAAGLSLAGLQPSKAATRMADCVVEVGGARYMDGPCYFAPTSHFGPGSFVVTGPGTMAAVNVQYGRGFAVWGPGVTQLGEVWKNGPCWQNYQAKICAWQPGEPRWVPYG